MKYWAFLSYSHTDKKWGDWLHKALESYRVPKRLVGKYSRDDKVPERVYPIFRDREELPASADLGAKINEALRESRCLIVICSPRSAQSHWVGEEIKTFKNLGREDRVLALIVDGEPDASDAKPGFKIEDECFHKAMRYRVLDGELSKVRSEPIAADAREGKDGKKNAKLKLLAGLLGVNYDELKQREHERRMQRVRIVVAACISLVGVFAVLSVALFFKQREAIRERDHAQATLSQSDFLQAQQLLKENKSRDALARLARSVAVYPANEAAVCQLVTLLGLRPHCLPVLELTNEKPDLTILAEFSPDGKNIAVGSVRATQVWSAETGRSVAALKWPETAYTSRAKGDPGHIESIDFSADSKRIAMVSEAGFACVWNAKNGVPLIDLIDLNPGDIRTVYPTIRFSLDGSRIVTSCCDKVQIWDAQTGNPIGDSALHLGVWSVQFSPDGTRVASLGADDTLRIWDAQTGRPLGAIEIEQGIAAAQFTPDSKRIATASGDVKNREARIWDVVTGQPFSEPMQNRDAPIIMGLLLKDRDRILEFSPNGERILLVGGGARVWNALTGQPETGLIKDTVSVTSARFSPDGKRLVTASEDNTARIWDSTSGKLLSDPIPIGASPEFSPDGKWILTTSHTGAHVWDARARKLLPLPIRQLERGVMQEIKSAEFSPDGKRIVTAGAHNATRVWDSNTGKPIGHPMEHNDPVDSAHFSPDGTAILTLVRRGLEKQGGEIRVWQAATGMPLTELMRDNQEVRSAEFSSDGKRIVTVTGPEYGESGKARIWDAVKGKPLGVLMIHNWPVKTARFSPDDKRIVTASGVDVRVWEPEKGKPLGTPIRCYANSACFSPDGKRILATESEFNSVEVFSAETGKPLIKRIQCGGLYLAQFSPDGERIVTASTSGARVWDARTGKPLTEPMKHERDVWSAQFSPNGKWILTVSMDSARIWDAETGSPITEPIKNDDFVRAAEFSHDGKQILITAIDRAGVWDILPLANRAPTWLPQLAETIAGEHLNDRGVFEPLTKDLGELFKQIREHLEHETSGKDWTIWGKWLLADPATRTISPFSKITVSEYIEDRIQENTSASLDEAEALAGGSTDILERIAAAREPLKFEHIDEEVRKAESKADYQGAVSLLKKLLLLRPDDSVASFELATILATCPEASVRNGKEAIVYAYKACKIDGMGYWEDPREARLLTRCFELLAEAYAEAQDFDQATKWETKCVENDQDRSEKEKRDTRDRLQLFQQHKAYHRRL